MIQRLFISISLCFSWFLQAAQPLLRTPAISPDGKSVAFGYQGDIWTVPTSGGLATRLTIHEGYESHPVFSPDGQQIAFQGSRFNNNDVFVMPSIGGMPQRLTYHSAGDQLSGFTTAGQILFTTTREFRQIERPQEIYTISAQGGTEMRLLDAVGYEPAMSPNGKLLAFVRGDINPVFRKDYRGPSNREIWIYNLHTRHYHRLSLFTTNDIQPQWAGNHQLYFLSSDDGQYNLYRLSLDADGKAAGKPEKLTNDKNESIRHYRLAVNSPLAVLEKDQHLYLLNTANKNLERMNITIRSDERFDAEEIKTMTSGAEEYVVSPNGKYMAYVLRGEIFITTADKDNARSVNVSNHPFRDYEPVWLNDTALIFSSDREDENFELYLLNSADSTQSNLFKSFKHHLSRLTYTPEDESRVVVDHAGQQIAYTRGRGTLLVSTIDAKGALINEKVLNNNGYALAGNLQWSPDDQWVAYHLSDLDFNTEVFIQAADNRTPAVNVSMHPRSDTRPWWSADGRKLAFLSERSYSTGTDVYFIWLTKTDWEKKQPDWKEDEPETTEKKDKEKRVLIDFDQIHQRIQQVTSLPGDEGELLLHKNSETFYYTAQSNTSRGRDLYSIKWDGTELKEMTKGGSNPQALTIDPESKNIYYFRNTTIQRLDLKTSTSENLPYTAKLKVDYAAERRQVFSEGWRTIRNGFYDPQMHGYDWAALRQKYTGRCLEASTVTDFRDMFNYLLGELNASHMALSAPERAETNRDITGLLGAELLPAKEGMLVKKIVPGTPADKTVSRLNVGDLILAVNGQPWTAQENFYALLNATAQEKILLHVRDAQGVERDVIIRPAQNISDELYREWVDQRKALVDNYSGGRLGYIHIRSMDFPSFEVVEREFTASGYGKEGLVIDVRYNGGGSTTDYLMTILNYKQHAYTIPRGAAVDLEKEKNKFRQHYPVGERLVFAAWTKPSVALCNEGSYSNAEIFSHAYQSLGIGKLVGVPTNGSVISTGGRQLMDGSFVRLPFRAWYTKATDKNQELGPAIPDILVENAPDWIATGEDIQLKIAVETLLKELGR